MKNMNYSALTKTIVIFLCVSLLSVGYFVENGAAQEQKGRPTIKILAMGKTLPGATEEKINALVKEEAARTWELYVSGIFRELYFRTDAPLPVVIMECKDLQEAKDIIATLPMVKAGLTDFDLMPLGPFFPFMALFAQE